MNEKTVKFSEAYQKNRVCLKDAIPLEMPLCISIEPTNICNFKCQMCGQSTSEYRDNGGPFGNMNMDLFHKALHDIKEFCHDGKRIKLIKLYSLGEPLLNPDIAVMLKEVKQADVAQQVEITSNASLLTRELAEKMVDYGLDFFRASIYGIRDESQKRVTQSNVTVGQIKENIRYMREYRDKKGLDKPYICAKMFEDKETDENLIFMKEYKGISDEQFIDVAFELPKLSDSALKKLFRGGAESAHAAYMKRVLYQKRKACRYPFTHLTVKSNGDVVICCTDWLRDTRLGNINEKSLMEIWNGKELYHFRVMMLETKGQYHPLCSTCEIPYKDCAEDDIDDVPVSRITFKE